MSESSDKPREGLRPCAVSSHQIYWRGWFHCFTGHGSKHGYALVESRSGAVEMLSLKLYSIKFLDSVPHEGER